MPESQIRDSQPGDPQPNASRPGDGSRIDDGARADDASMRNGLRRRFDSMSERRRLTLFAVPMAALTVAGWVGDALAPTLLGSAPLLLMVLNPRSRTMLLTAPLVPAVPFLVVAVIRQLLADPLFFAFGRRYGDTAIRWAERKAGSASRSLRLLEGLFARAAHPAVAVVPNNIICLLAGATGMTWGVFLALNIGGTIVKVALIRLAADAFEGTITAITDWISDNRLWLTAITLTIAVIAALRARRSPSGALESPEELAAELAEAEADPEAPHISTRAPQ